MPIEIVRYEARHIPAVLAFNSRLREAGVNQKYGIRHLLPETEAVRERSAESGMYDESYLAVEGEDVRGGYVLQRQDFLLNDEVVSAGLFRHPLSEGTIHPRYSLVGPRLLRDALRRQPLLYGVGIGGFDVAAARLLKGAGFSMEAVPFFFRVEHAAAFLRQVQLLRSSRLRRLVSDIGATTGLGALGIGVIQRVRAGRPKRGRRVTVREFATFDGSADAVWAACRPTIDFGAVRDRAVLAALYDAPGNRFLKVSIDVAGESYGWAVCLATQGQDNKYFGNLKLGSIIDCLARPGSEVALMNAAIGRLRRERVDLIVTNQHLPILGGALRVTGFLSGPSNYLFAAAPALAAQLQPPASGHRRVHMNRGDGDGPVNL